jgi:hypothetical protein
MTLLTVAQVRAVVTTALDDTRLSEIIEREEAEAERRFGVPGDGTTSRTETLEACGADVFTAAPILTVSSVTERTLTTAAQTVAASRYHVWHGQGRITKTDGVWLPIVTVTYVPADVRDRWRSVLIEIVRQALEQTAMRSENVADEYDYQAPEWEAQRVRLYRRLKFTSF